MGRVAIRGLGYFKSSFHGMLSPSWSTCNSVRVSTGGRVYICPGLYQNCPGPYKYNLQNVIVNYLVFIIN